MTIYTCDKCKKYKTCRKTDFNRHLNRKRGCVKNEDKCICGREYSRKSSLDRHQKKCELYIGSIDNSKIDQENNTIINFELSSFGNDGIDCLSNSEKMAIFSSNENLIEMIVFKVNLDPIKINHHNIRIPDNKTGYGIYFNGNRWIMEKISVIMEILLDSKEKDLLKIYEEIKDFFSDNDNENINKQLQYINNVLRRGTEKDIYIKKNWIARLTKHLYNNRNLAIEAEKKIGNPKIEIGFNNKQQNILKEGITIEEIERQIGIRKKTQQFLYYLLDLSYKYQKIDWINYDLIKNKIDNMNNQEILNAMMRILLRSAYFGTKIDNKIIDEKISRENKMKEFFTETK